ncbi:MAG: AAA family ATPase [Candidatus Sulfotelmatobacter sp.]
MLLKFFGLREHPFGVTPDPRYLYLSPGPREALASLFYGIESERGFLALIAPPGMGKTTLLFHLLEKFRTSARTAFLFQTQCTSREFMRFLLAELGYETGDHDFVRMHEEFNQHLLREARAGNRFIVVVDEAQNLDPSVLETIRLLSDFETPQAKLLQIVLAGQPELADKLASRHLAQLRQRISLVSSLKPLSEEETRNYVQHRLRVAGYLGGSLFTPQAMAETAEFTQGIPRNINNLCFNAMSLACALRQKTIDTAIVREVISDLDITQHVSRTGVDITGSTALATEDGQVETEWSAPGPGETGVPGASGPFDPLSRRKGKKETLTPTEARDYLQRVAGSLKGGQS